MEIQKIETVSAPKPKGFYSQAVKVGQFVFTSGQLPVNPNTGEIVKGETEEQFIQIMNNITAILEEAGSSLERVVKTTIFIREIDQWGIINRLYEDYFKKSTPPARSIIAGADIHYEASIEMEVIACTNE